jgi:NAD(P)-dependent dehydrogenase (short-subunit alcohol dehydrogenase family)
MPANPFELTGLTAVVTAGCAGVGAAIAETLAGSGARVVATSREADRAKAFEQTTKGRIAGRQLAFEDAAIRTFVGNVAEEFGSLDILVNGAAGRGAASTVEATGAEAMMEEFQDGCVTALLCSQAAVAAQERTRIRSIVNIGSIYGSLAVDHRIYTDPARQTPLAYACAKGALVQMTRYLAAYWAPRGVRVNCISAGGVRGAQDQEFLKRYSQRVPLARMAEPNEISAAVAFLASDASSYITGIDLAVDGGLHAW